LVKNKILFGADFSKKERKKMKFVERMNGLKIKSYLVPIFENKKKKNVI